MSSSLKRRTAIIAVIGLLVGGSVGAGALVAVAQPNSIAFTTPSGNVVGPWGGVAGNIDWTFGGAGGTISLTVVNSAGTNTHCTAGYLSTDVTFDCVPPLEYGENTLTATATETDDPGNPLTSAPIVITYGGTQAATITSPPDSSSSTTSTPFAGTGSQMGTVTLRARPVGSSDPGDFVDICAPAPVDEAGTWDCVATFPERRIWTVQAQSVTLTGIDYGPPASQTFTFDNERPDTTVVSTPGALRLDATPGATGATVSTTWRYYADSADGGSIVADCPAAASQACAVPGTPLAGLYLASSNAYANDAGSSDRGDFVRIPATPVITSTDDSVPGQLSVVGTFDPTFSEPFGQVTGDGTPVVDIIDADTSAVLCGDIELALSGDWNCTTPAPVGTFDYVAVARTSTPIGTSGAQDVFSPGTSSRSNLVTTTVTPGGTLAITTPSPSGGASEWQPGATSFLIEGTSTLSADVDVLLNGVPLGTSCTNRPVVAGDWSCTTALEAGTHQIRAVQLGSVDAVVAWTVTIPEPVVSNADPYVIPSWGNADFTGTAAYPTGEVVVEVEVGDGFYESCIDAAPYDAGDTWSCSVNMYGYDDGTYNVRAFVVDEVEQSGYAYSTLIVGDPPVTPDLTCSFGPASATISSTHPMGLYHAYPSSGSGSGWFYELADQALCNGAPGNTFPDGTEFEGSLVSGCASDCNVSGLAPGLYEVYVESGGGYSYLFTIPETPVFATTASSGSNVITTGTGTAYDRIHVRNPDGGILCSTTVSSGGAWACTFPRSSATSARVIAIDPASGGMSSYTAARSIPVPLVPLETQAPEEVPVAVLNWLLKFGGDLTQLKPGDTFTVTIDGMPEGWAIEMWMHSTPRLLGADTATGAPMEMTLTVPEDIEAGAHEIEMVATTPNGTSYFERTDAMVLASETTEETPTDETPIDEGLTESGGGGGAMGTARQEPAAPSALTESIPTLDRIVANPVTVAIAGGLALALLFLVALPTELLNSSLSSNTSRLGRVYGSIDGAMSKAQDWFIRVTRSRALAAGLITVIVAIVYGFIDPGFGFDVVSLRLVLSLALAFFILSYGASWLSGFVIRRLWGTSAVIAIQPSIILFAIVGVVVARILDFSPGFLIGIAIGLELISASRRVSARAVLVQFLFVVGLSLAAWVAYSLFNPGDDFGGMLVEDTLVAVTAEGLTGALIAVFPLQFMDGRELWLDSKRLWVGAFLLVAVPFSLLVLPTAVEGTDVGDYGIWLLVFAVFGLISVAIWLVFARAAKREEERVAAEESVDA